MEDTYKENLIINCRHVMQKHDGRLIVRGRGISRKLSFYAADGRQCVVWFPTETRFNDVEVQDAKDTLHYLTGEYPFQK